SWTMAEPTRVFGLAYWWVAELTEGIAVSTAPSAPASHWEQLYFPSAEPLDLDRGESLRALIRSSSSFERGTHLSWSLSRTAPDGKVLRRHKMDLDQGYLP
ncbi:MAG: ribonucleotide-diphosphate reductase subunit beta, partial [Pseudomonadota bacterium]